MVNIEQIRHELQISEYVISDASVNYALSKFDEDDDVNLIFAEVLRMVLRKHGGLAVRRIGKYYEEIDPKAIRKLINDYTQKAATSVFDDGFEHPDAWFERDGI